MFDDASRVVVHGLEDGAQDDLDQLLKLALVICEKMESGAKWIRRIGIAFGIGVASFIFVAGAWYFKVDTHVDRDEAAMVVQGKAIESLSLSMERVVAVNEGFQRRLEMLEERTP